MLKPPDPVQIVNLAPATQKILQRIIAKLPPKPPELA